MQHNHIHIIQYVVNGIFRKIISGAQGRTFFDVFDIFFGFATKVRFLWNFVFLEISNFAKCKNMFLQKNKTCASENFLSTAPSGGPPPAPGGWEI